jgi:hypothetical protein
MRLNKGIIISLGLVFLLLVILGYILWPTASELYSDLTAYETRQATNSDYELHTTPLPLNVVEDICLQLEIESQNESCKPGAVVYAPELFDELKTYFRNLPNQDKTYTVVQNKLGIYLVNCDRTNSEGNFSCRYDLRGDGAYTVAFFFDKDGFYWQIIANVGGS